MVTMVADMIVEDRNARETALVELKNRIDLSPEVAEDVRRSLLARFPLRSVRFMLLLSQDTGYLWDESAAGNGMPRRLQFDMTGVVERYYRRLPPSERLRENELGLIAFAWLMDLTWVQDTESLPEPDRSLAQAGFLDAIRDGDVLTEVPWS